MLVGHGMLEHPHTDNVSNFDTPCQKDSELMRKFLSAGFSMEELVALNHHHMHNRVLFVLDIFTGAGKQVDDKWLQPAISPLYAMYSWPCMGKQTAAEQVGWNQAVQMALKLDIHLQLPWKLGA